MSKEFLQDAAGGIVISILLFLLISGNFYPALPFLLLAGLAAALYFGGGIAGIATRNSVGEPVTAIRVSFDDIGGQEAAKRELLEALEFIKDPDRRRRLGIRPLRGIMLAGPPGTGKTLLAKAAASYSGSAFLSASGSEFIELYAGVGAQRVRGLFRRARQLARGTPSNSAVIFIDEIEVLAGQRGRHASHQEYDQTLNQLLVEMDGISTTGDQETIVVIAATNRIDLIDDALLRPGRFDRIVHVQLPDREARYQILSLHIRGKPLASDVDLDALARQTFGFSGAHLEALVNEAAIFAWRENSRHIHQRHLEEAVEKVMLGERLGRLMTGQEKRRIAVHEAGHALVSELLRPGSVASVTIVARGSALGYVRRHPSDDESLWTQPELEAQAQIALGGYAAEALILGNTSTGATADLDQFAQIIDQMIAAGMSPLGPVAPGVVPEAEKHRVAMEMSQRLRDQVFELVSGHLHVVDQLVEELLVEESLDGDQVRRIIQQSLKDSLHHQAGIGGAALESPFS